MQILLVVVKGKRPNYSTSDREIIKKYDNDHNTTQFTTRIDHSEVTIFKTENRLRIVYSRRRKDNEGWGTYELCIPINSILRISTKEIY